MKKSLIQQSGQYWRPLWLMATLGATSFAVQGIIGYRAVGFIFLLGVILTAFLGTLPTALFAATLSVFVWNFFFIPPKFTFTILHTDDALMCITYFIVATITGILTSRIRKTERAIQENTVLQESERLHQILLNSISHEIRTPLTTILGAVSALDEETTGTLEFRREILQQLGGASDRLNRVVENLLDMSRLNSGVMTLKKEWHDVHDLIGVTLQRLGQNTNTHKMSTHIQDPLPLIQIDFRLIEHALSNLIVNALTYAPNGSEITITAKVLEHYLLLSIEDEGSGVPIESQEKIFEKFYRVPGTPAGGLGLGLSIVENIVELHKGSIDVKNTKGACFSIYLPIGSPPPMPVEVVHA